MSPRRKRIVSKKENPQEVKILVHPEVHKGVYSNVAMVHLTKNEFIMDFVLQFGGEAQLVSRVIFSPEHMRAFKDVIHENLKKYDKEYGENKSNDKRKAKVK